MCGITGFWDVGHRLDAEQAAVALRRMTRAIRHRGPDDEGYFQDAATGIALGDARVRAQTGNLATCQQQNC